MSPSFYHIAKSSELDKDKVPKAYSLDHEGQPCSGIFS